MKRYLALIGAGAIAVASTLGAVSAQSEPVDADGSYVVANDDGTPIVSGAGEDYVIGPINTGGAQGEVLGDPSAVYSPNVPNNPGPEGGFLVMPGAGDGMIGGVPMQPAAPDATTNTVTNVATGEGMTTQNIPVQALVPAETAPAPTDSAPVATGFCAQYGTWYDAQVAYEGLGGTAADPALVQEVDADYDGIACEGVMA
jgi:hypothetical protein